MLLRPFENILIFSTHRPKTKPATYWIAFTSLGLTLTLNTEEYEYVGELSPDVGARITILPQEQMPFPGDEGISVMPGMVTFVGLRKVNLRTVSYRGVARGSSRGSGTPPLTPRQYSC